MGYRGLDRQPAPSPYQARVTVGDLWATLGKVADAGVKYAAGELGAGEEYDQLSQFAKDNGLTMEEVARIVQDSGGDPATVETKVVAKKTSMGLPASISTGTSWLPYVAIGGIALIAAILLGRR